jgi:SAM-dependent methyltransferase
MPPDRRDCPLVWDDPADFARLRGVLTDADFTDRGVLEAVGPEASSATSEGDLQVLLRATRRARPLDTLIRLFLMDVPADVDQARRAVAPMQLDEWVEAGLLEIEGGSVTASVRLLPCQGLWLSFDKPTRIASPEAADYVMGIGSSSRTLANLTVRRPFETALDLGTGCGYQAFLAARHTARVVAVDRNPRAVGITRFNAMLNDLANVKSLAGDLFEPVQGRTFDLVVSNPPFVISPESKFIYRDSGMSGDQITQTIVRQVPPLLAEGGYCQVLCNWAHLAGQDWKTRLAAWFEGTGCDAWVMRSDTLDAAPYAAKWIRHTERDDPDGFAERFDRWMEHYDRHRIEAVSGGLITLRKRSGAANWYRADEAPEKMLGPVGEAIAGRFEACDFLEAFGQDERLVEQRLQVAPQVRLHQQFQPDENGWASTQGHLRLEAGLAYSGNVDPYMTRLIGRCDGRRPLRGLINELAESAGQDPSSIAPTCLEIVRQLIEQGFLMPAHRRTGFGSP